MFNQAWDILVRWRTYFANLALALMIVLPDVLNAPEVLAVVPEQYQKYVLAAAVLVNIWLRPRPASRAADPEVVANDAAKAEAAATGKPVSLMIRPTGEDAVKVATVEPKGTAA